MNREIQKQDWIVDEITNYNKLGGIVHSEFNADGEYEVDTDKLYELIKIKPKMSGFTNESPMVDLDSNEFDDFLGKKGLSGLMKGITKSLTSCLKEVSDKNPKFKKEKLKGLNKTDKAEYQKLMKACMQRKKKKAPKIIHKSVGATEYDKMRENQMSEKQIAKFKRAEEKRKELALQRKQEQEQQTTAVSPPPQEEKGWKKYKTIIYVGAIAVGGFILLKMIK